jgi:hypothetical protein
MAGKKTLDYDRIEKLWKQGLDRKTIALRLDCSPASITRVLQARGYEGDWRNNVAGVEVGVPSELHHRQPRAEDVESLI